MKSFLKYASLMILMLILVGCKNEIVELPVEVVVEVVEEEEVKEKVTVTLNMMGRASVRLDFSDGKVVYIDPYIGSDEHYEAEADLILVTHQHEDHNLVERVTLKEDGKIIECPMDIKSGMKETVKGLEIIAVEAYNGYHSSSSSCGFIIKYEDIVIYHSGDTSTTANMASLQEYDIDYALLCMDDFYNMGPAEAMEVTDLILPQAVIPMHTAKSGSYSRSNVAAFTHPLKLVVKPGQSLVMKDLHSPSKSFDEAIVEILDDRLKAIETKDYDLYMTAITKQNPYFFNEQERWFMGMIEDGISDVSFEIVSTTPIDEKTAVVDIKQTHTMDKTYTIEYPLLFKYEMGSWKDRGYNFEILETDHFKIKYMKDEVRVEEFKMMLEDAFDHLDGLYAEKPHSFFEMKLFSDQEMLRQRTIPANGWLFTGWSEPDESLKLYTSHPSSYEGYPGVVQHEVVHHITIRMCNNNLPVWMLEGIAMYDGSAYYGFETSSLLSKLTKRGVTKTLAEIEAIDLGSNLTGTQIRNYYNTSYMYVRYIFETYGRETLMDLFYEAGKKPFHDSTLNDTFEINNQITAGKVIEKILGLTKEELSEDYLEWLENTDI